MPMTFTLSWLREHLDFTASLEEICAKLNVIGLEVERVENPADALKGFRTAKIIEAVQHPDADRLRVCRVAGGEGHAEIQVVCGAPNARTGLHVILATPGAVVPANGMTIKSGAIRGQKSEGMLCSFRELGLGEDHEGIAELPDGSPIGVDYAAFARLDDPVIEIAITPNRGDALSVRGVARDLAAAGIGHLRPLLIETVEGRFASPIGFAVEDDGAGSFVVGRMVRGVRNGPSPGWLRSRLESIGVKSISTLVDITNLLVHDLGRPLHVYDAAKLAGDTLTICRAARESFTGLDEREHVLGTDDLVIVDANGVQSLAGILGGAASACSMDTTDVLIESALFDAVQIALTGRRLGIHTDARARNERGVDPALPLPGLELATKLILELCGGEASEIVSAGTPPNWERSARLRFARVAALGGIEIAPDDAIRALEHLGFEVQARDTDGAVFRVPSWRNDIANAPVLDAGPGLAPARAAKAAASVAAIEAECDLIEEVLRLRGLDAVEPVALPQTQIVQTAALEPTQARLLPVCRAVASRGLLETIGFSFVAHADAVLFGGGDENLRLLNPIASDLDQLRPTPLVNLVRAFGRNMARGSGPVGLFELGPAFGAAAGAGGQARVLAGLRGGVSYRAPGEAAREPSVWEAKADLWAALEALGAPLEGLTVTQDAPSHYHPGRSGQVRQGPKLVLGRFGELHPKVARTLGLDGTPACFELFVDAVPLPKRKRRTAPQLSSLQPLSRDFAFLIGRDVGAQDLVRAVRGAERSLITAVRVFDVYEGRGVPEGQRSVGVEVMLQPLEASLTDAQIEAVCERIVAAAAKACGAVLR